MWLPRAMSADGASKYGYGITMGWPRKKQGDLEGAVTV